MKKLLVIILCLALLICAGCSKGNGAALSPSDDQFLNNNVEYAYVYLPDGTLLKEGKVEYWSWSTQCDKANIQIDGMKYITSWKNVLLTKEADK